MIKQLAAISFLVLSLYACSGSEITEEKKESAVKEEAAPNVSPDYEKGLKLIAQADCLTCHKVEEKVTGPAYREVANKYPDTPQTIDSLAGKIIHGGSGIWGTIPMTPHPALSQEDAKQMVKYIMLLKNK